MNIDLQNWQLLIGILSGIISLLAWVIKWIRIPFIRPKLNIIKFDKSKDLVIWKTYHNGMNKLWTRKFLNLLVERKGKETAKRCEAIVSILSCPQNVGLVSSEYAIHWADIDYSGRTTGAYPVDIGSSPHRLDVVFSDKDNPVGAWLAIPFALLDPAKANQFYLPPGDYIIKIDISCENGGGTTKKFKVISPRNWTDLDVDEL